MTIFRFSIVVLLFTMVLAAGYGLSEYNRLRAIEKDRKETTREAKLLIDRIVRECEIPRTALIPLDELDATAFLGYEVKPITLNPSYGWCPLPENDEKIACADQQAMAAGFLLGRPAIIGECPRYGIFE